MLCCRQATANNRKLVKWHVQAMFEWLREKHGASYEDYLVSQSVLCLLLLVSGATCVGMWVRMCLPVCVHMFVCWGESESESESILLPSEPKGSM